MIQVIPFGLGIIAGAVAVRALEKVNVTKKVESAKNGLRGAAVNGLAAIESGSANLKKIIEAPKKTDAGGTANPQEEKKND